MHDSQYSVTVGPTDTDSYNIVHHPMYLVWCEAAIYQYLLANPETYPVTEYEIRHFSCKFQSPARLHDRLNAVVVCAAQRQDEPTQFRVQLSNAETGAVVVNAKFELVFP